MRTTRSGKVLESVNSARAQSSKLRNKITTTAGKVVEPAVKTITSHTGILACLLITRIITH